MLIDEFVEQAQARGLQPVALRATTLDGHTVKTDKHGWYIRQNRSLAIGTEGQYYVLMVPGGWKERLRGVKVERSDPPLYVGKGGRDGETGDLKEFLAQLFDDLRLGLTAATATLYAGDWRATGVLVPRRPTSRLPAPGSPWYPLPPDVLGVPVELTEPAPEDSTLRAAEAAVRLTYAGLPRTDVAVLWISGFNRLPAFRKGLRLTIQPAFDAALTVTPAYERRHVFGLTAETLALDPVVLRGEAAFHTAYLLDQPVVVPQTLGGLLDPDFQDAVARGFLIEKPFVQAALGLERAFGSHLVRVQALGSLVLDHDDRVAQDRFEPSFTALWNGRFRRETLTAQVFAFYTPGADYWLNPALTYAVRDALNATLGLQVFGGAGEADASLPGLLREPAPSFVTYDRNDFAYLRVSYSF